MPLRTITTHAIPLDARRDPGAAGGEGSVKVALVGCLGLVLGALVGGLVGIGLGLAWTKVFDTSSFEGYSGMLVFFTFMPIGAIVGAIAGGVGLGYAASRGSGG